MPPKERKLSTQSRQWHPRVVQLATCPVRELSSNRLIYLQRAVQRCSRRKVNMHSSVRWTRGCLLIKLARSFAEFNDLRRPKCEWFQTAAILILTDAVVRQSVFDFLWPPYGYRAGHYIFARWFLSSFFYLFSSPNLSDCRLDVYRTSTHGVALVRIYNAGLKCAACGSLEIQNAKNRHFGTIAQFCRARPISSELRYVSTTGKNY